MDEKENEQFHRKWPFLCVAYHAYLDMVHYGNLLINKQIIFFESVYNHYHHHYMLFIIMYVFYDSAICWTSLC